MTLKRSPIARGTSTLKRSRVKARNPERKAKEFKRTYTSVERVMAIKAMRCLVDNFMCSVPVDNAHVPSKSGAGRKGDAKHNVPLCRWHHTDSPHALDNTNKEAFNARFGLDLDAEAAKIEALYPSTAPLEG